MMIWIIKYFETFHKVNLIKLYVVNMHDLTLNVLKE